MKERHRGETEVFIHASDNSELALLCELMCIQIENKTLRVLLVFFIAFPCSTIAVDLF